ncbi:MAG: beta-glucosidase, partial [Chitinophagaceae bacterium]|nr:beta-glucosidase [Chitinophagaceae bacterium]
MKSVVVIIPMLYTALMLAGCGKKSSTPPPPPPAPAALRLVNATLNGEPGPSFVGVGFNPVVRFHFNQRVDKVSAATAVSMSDDAGVATAFGLGWERGDSTLVISPGSNAIKGLTRYSAVLTTALKSAAGVALDRPASISFITRIDSTAKFPAISNDSLLTLVQRQTFRYFWDFAHPASGMARERNSSGDLVTSGGSGFGLMAIITGIHRGFITRQQGLARLQLVVDFLKNKAQRFKGAFPHWMNGNTGAVIPFSANDNGADLVETSLLAMGLIAAREYFDNAAGAEQSLRSDINSILNAIEWSWFRKNNEQVLYWHWSADRGWAINLKIQGWNECLLTYVLAAGATQHSIP